jgi:lipid II isoglutaminyl synthase (glutamine-hydrolysing)
MAGPRTVAAVWAAKAAARASRALGRGGGTAVSGLAALQVQPDLVRELVAGLGRGSVLITGTNGKTTTSHLIGEMARAAGLQPLANTSGSNLMRGIAATLALSARIDGSLDGDKKRIGVFEVDEAAMPDVMEAVRPRVVVFGNLFRDQLDRYGEVEAVASRWREALARTALSPTLVLNADDPNVASLGEGRHRAVYFGINDRALDRGRPEHAADALTCICGADYEYGIAYFGHIGHWRCPNCGRARPSTQITAHEIDLKNGRAVAFSLGAEGRAVRVEMAIGGLYNVYNALAATAAALSLGLPEEAVLESLPRFAAAFGRQESFELNGKRVEVFLSKNPAGTNQVISTLGLDPTRRVALIILNDGIADGQDISWVWDADYEAAAGRFRQVIVAGSRAEDMALRLKYAEWDESTFYIEAQVPSALDRALAETQPGECLTVIPTYTAMLEVRELLAKKAGRQPYWSS